MTWLINSDLGTRKNQWDSRCLFPKCSFAPTLLLAEIGQQDLPMTAVIDLNDALTGYPEMFPDKIHPNAAGATLMARTIFQAIRP